VTGKEFEQAQLVVPPSSLRNRFHEITEPMLSLSWCLHQQNVNLRITRDLLLPKLISGELSVETAAHEHASELMEQTA
jgi:type I restriction enzyme, S subunit